MTTDITNHRLLVVEDDGLIRLELVDTLEEMGYAVIDAANADEALRVLEGNEDISAVLTDIDMPGSVNGLGLANIVYERWPPLKVVVISGRYSPSDGMMPPGAKFVTKPVSERMIEQALTEVGISLSA
jgi:DNA-binding NtrC family response regulator